MAAKETGASPTAIDAPQHVLDLLNRLHEKSLAQENDPKHAPAVQATRTLTDEPTRTREHALLMRDKFIALEPDKAAFMYNLVRATGSLNVVECGTSYGVSTIYLALAIGQNARDAGKDGKVIATEHESDKSRQAREYWKEAGEDVQEWIDLREGDLRETLKKDVPTIDLVLMDSESLSLRPFEVLSLT